MPSSRTTRPADPWRDFWATISANEIRLEKRGFDAYSRGLRRILAEKLPLAGAAAVRKNMERRTLEKIFLIACTTSQPFSVVDSLLTELEDLRFSSVDRMMSMMGLFAVWLQCATEQTAAPRAEQFIVATSTRVGALRKGRLKSECEIDLELARERLSSFRRRSGT